MLKFAFLPFVFLTILCWGNYGVLMHHGKESMGDALRPFVGVGFAYFAIAVVVPALLLARRGEKGHWSRDGVILSIVAGAVGALGALGVILAFSFKAKPIYVMPLVFGGAPVINTLVTMAMTPNLEKVKPIFLFGILMAALGGAGVLYFKPSEAAPKPLPVAAADVDVHADVDADPLLNRFTTLVQTETGDEPAVLDSLDELEPTPAAPNGSQPSVVDATDEVTAAEEAPAAAEAISEDTTTAPAPAAPAAAGELNFPMIAFSIALAVLSWGAYGPVLHKGQMKMGGSRLRPFLCVGIAYFIIAVAIPLAVIPVLSTTGSWTGIGMAWSLAGGAAGALGALGIIYAFNFGGKPIFVMPLIFGMAPVMNTVTTLTEASLWGEIGPKFLAALAVTIVGAVTVLIYAPKAVPPAGTAKAH